MSWHDVMDQQTDLVKFWSGPMGESVARGFQRAAERTEMEVHGRVPSDMYGNIQESEFAKLANADPFYVDPDMMTLIEHASEGFKPEPLHESDLLTKIGFV